MATIIKANGEKENFEKEIITIVDISKLINGIVEPILANDSWVFICKNGKKLKRDYNKTISEMIDFKVYGDVVVAKDDELSCSFYFPETMVDELLQESINNEEYDDDENTEDDKEEDLILKTAQKIKDAEEKEKQAREFIIQNAYKWLFITDLTFEEIMQNFCVHQEEKIGTDKIERCYIDNKEDRFTLIDGMLEYYIKEEEYEKCSEILNFKNKMIEYYVNK